MPDVLPNAIFMKRQCLRPTGTRSAFSGFLQRDTAGRTIRSQRPLACLLHGSRCLVSLITIFGAYRIRFRQTLLLWSTRLPLPISTVLLFAVILFFFVLPRWIAHVYTHLWR